MDEQISLDELVPVFQEAQKFKDMKIEKFLAFLFDNKPGVDYSELYHKIILICCYDHFNETLHKHTSNHHLKVLDMCQDLKSITYHANDIIQKQKQIIFASAAKKFRKLQTKQKRIWNWVEKVRRLKTILLSMEDLSDLNEVLKYIKNKDLGKPERYLESLISHIIYAEESLEMLRTSNLKFFQTFDFNTWKPQNLLIKSKFLIEAITNIFDFKLKEASISKVLEETHSYLVWVNIMKLKIDKKRYVKDLANMCIKLRKVYYNLKENCKT